MRFSRKFGRCRSGATSIEFSVVGLVFLLLCIGMVEFGRGFFLRNHIAHAADVASRKLLLDPNLTNSELEQAFRAALTEGDESLLQITITDDVANGISVRKMAADYPHTLLVPGLSSVTLSVSRHIPLP